MRSVQLCVWLCASFALACGPARPVNTYRPIHGGDCPEDRGCELPLDEQGRFERPDEGGPIPAEHAEARTEAPEPVEATCALVAAAMASLEVGDHADADARAPLETRYADLCRSTRLDAEERACILEAHDRDAAMYCAPRMFPGARVDLVDPSECKAIMTGIRRRMRLPAPAGLGWEIRLAALEASCRADRWPHSFGECARSMYLPMRPLPCLHVAPPMLERRLAARLAVH
jgi:hypothetical protein